MSDKSKGTSSKPATTQAAGGTKAQQYINGLYAALQSAQNDYQTQNSILNNYKTQQNEYTDKYSIAKAHTEQLEGNLTLAKSAEKDIGTILAFFKTQQKAVAEMVSNAENASTAAFESLAFLVHQGVGRVEAVNQLINGDNQQYNEKKQAGTLNPPNTPVPWVSTVTDSIGKAQASGSAAVKSGTEASQTAFSSYVSNHSIFSRTSSYLASFTSFQKQIESLKNRLVTEASLAKSKSSLLKVQLNTITERVTALNLLVDKKKIKLDEAQNMYNAAQQGASYAGAAAS